MNNKTNEASFLEEGKETFKNRLKQLLKGVFELFQQNGKYLIRR